LRSRGFAYAVTRGPDTTSRRQRTWAAGWGRTAGGQSPDPRPDEEGDERGTTTLQGLKVARICSVSPWRTVISTQGRKKGCPIHMPLTAACRHDTVSPRRDQAEAAGSTAKTTIAAYDPTTQRGRLSRSGAAAVARVRTLPSDRRAAG
jgi:hypothetical protein